MIPRIEAVLRDAPVVDGHNDLLWQLRTFAGYDFDVIDIARDQSQPTAGSPAEDSTSPATGGAAPGRWRRLHTDLPRLRAGGVGAQFWSVWVPCEYPEIGAVPATLEQIDAAYRMIARYPDELRLARTAAEVRQAAADGRIASLLGIEGGHCIASSLGTLRMMYQLGVRYMTLTHNKNTPWADSATDEPKLGGLNDFGRQVVREMNRLGMLVDLSHVAPSTMHAALDVSTAPAFFSHSSARAVCDHPRNVPDDVLSRVADTEGVVMVTFVPGFLNEECRTWMTALEAEWERVDELHQPNSAPWRAVLEAWLKANPRPPCAVTDVADHVEHVREAAGVDHVGLGGDYDGCVHPPDGMADVTGYPALLAELADRGWSDADLAKLTWHNALRVLEATGAAASR